MLPPSLRVSSPHPRRAAQGLAGDTDPHPLAANLLHGRRHEVLVASHRVVAPAGRSFWNRWFQERLQPGRKVY